MTSLYESVEDSSFEKSLTLANRFEPVDAEASVAAPTVFPRWRETGPLVSVVIPTLNEAKNLPEVLPRIPSWVHEVILVDGRSTDGTLDVARSLWSQILAERNRHAGRSWGNLAIDELLEPSADLVTMVQPGRGKGDALRAGFAAARGDIIVMLDADGSTDPGEIPAYVGALLGGADYAKGSRFLQGGGTADMSFHRRLGNWAFVKLVRLLFGGQYSDLCYGYNAFWVHVHPQLELDCTGFEVETLMNVRALNIGLKIAEVPSFEAERIHGTSNLRAIPDGWRVLKVILKEMRKTLGSRKGERAGARSAAGRSVPASNVSRLHAYRSRHLKDQRPAGEVQ